jgi:hypothetical protein
LFYCTRINLDEVWPNTSGSYIPSALVAGAWNVPYDVVRTRYVSVYTPAGETARAPGRTYKGIVVMVRLAKDSVPWLVRTFN